MRGENLPPPGFGAFRLGGERMEARNTLIRESIEKRTAKKGKCQLPRPPPPNPAPPLSRLRGWGAG